MTEPLPGPDDVSNFGHRLRRRAGRAVVVACTLTAVMVAGAVLGVGRATAEWRFFPGTRFDFQDSRDRYWGYAITDTGTVLYDGLRTRILRGQPWDSDPTVL